MKSTLINMTAVLFGITLVASAGVGAVYMITAEPIAQAEEAAKKEALTQVLPAFDATEAETLAIDEMPITVYTATHSGAVSGYAVETMSKSGFGGPISLMVGFTPEGEVVNVNVLKQAETPGLGTKMADEGNPLLKSFQGNNPGNMKLSVKKDGGDVEALTAATISSRAYVDAIARAWKAFQSVTTGAAPVDTPSGATTLVADSADEAAEATETENQEGGQNE